MDCSVKTKAKLILGYLISWLFFCISLIAVIFMIATGIFVGGFNTAWNKFVSNQMYRDAEEAFETYCLEYWDSIFWEDSYYFSESYYNALYSKNNSNFRFTAVSKEGTKFPGYYYEDEKKAFVEKYEFSFYTHNFSIETEYFSDENDAYEYLNEKEDEGRYCVINELDLEYEVEVYPFSYDIDNVTMQVYIPVILTADDEYYVANTVFYILNMLKYWIVAILAISTLMLAVFTVMLINRCGRRNGDDKIYLLAADKIPYEIFSALILLPMGTIIVIPLIIAFDYNFRLLIYFIGYAILAVVALAIAGLLLIEFILSTVVRIKDGTLFTNTVIYRFFRGLSVLWQGVKTIFRKIAEILSNIKAYKTTAGLFIGLDFLISILFFYASNDFTEPALLFLIAMAAIVLVQLHVVYSLYMLQNACDKIAAGELNYRVEDKYMLKYFGGMVESINNISMGMNNALQESIRSEQFKAELITNVSHDIKTPLTSIISYVNLLQSNKISGEDAAECLDVLERQSEKLKKLIEDLVEASKASTGNLSIDYSVVDIGILLEQAVGEYTEKFETMNLNVIFDRQTEETYIRADGKYIWRIIDNLLSNICKYSLENTRVYITLNKNDDGKCVITFKNISKYEIKLTPEELTERFVRGDKSRNTEGSGLGLSIARNLAEAMNGQMYIEMDGDLYKAILVFESVEISTNEESVSVL